MPLPVLALCPLLILCGAPLLGQTSLTVVEVATAANNPTFATFAPGDRERMFVVEQAGLIRVNRYRQNILFEPVPFLDLTSRVRFGGEDGLLGLAFHPDYQNNGFFYVFYNRPQMPGDPPAGATVLERYRVSANPDVADPNSGVLILDPIPQPFSGHNGGCLRFGPQGYLYVSTGDGGGGDPSCSAQNGQSLLGKLLRIDVDNPAPGRNYGIPPTNPFVVNPAFRDEIWAYGLRNPWQFSFDRATGDLWIGDVGEDDNEELDFQAAASGGGQNYGWKLLEGTQPFSTSGCAAGAPTLVPPIHEYAHTVGGSDAVIAGHVYRGRAIPDLRGTFFFADYDGTLQIWSLRYDGATVTDFTDRSVELTPLGGGLRLVTSFAEDPDGELLIVTRLGRIWLVVPRGPHPARDLGFGTPGSNQSIPGFGVAGRFEPGSIVELRLSAALPNTLVALAVSGQNAPTAFPPFGTVVPGLPWITAFLFTGASGEAAVPVVGGLPPWVFYGQWVVLDTGGPGGLALSNALEITIP